MNEPIWTPAPERVAASNLTRFAEFARRRHGAPDGAYATLWRWSVTERERFWQALMEFAGVVRDDGTGPVLRDRDRMPGAVWFEDTRLNYAENLLAGDEQAEAIVFVNERGTRRTLSRSEFRRDVARIAAGLRDLGIGEGDRVAGFMPNLPETIVAMLATTSLGAVWTSCSPDFGINGVLDRFGQVTPRVLLTADGYFYGRGVLDNKQGVVGIATALLRLRAEGFQPGRDIYVLFTGDEETEGNGADRAAGEWLANANIEYALNGDAGGGGYLAKGTALGFGIQTAEKIYQDFTLTATNPGGHSSRPRPDNAIYELARVLQRLERHRFEPRMNDTTRAMLTHRLQTAEPPLAAAIRRWLANPNDGEAADIIEATPTEVGLTRTRCVATMLNGGHAPNALPQQARANVNCRMFPGTDPATVLAALREIARTDNVTVEPVRAARPSDASPLREDVMAAYRAAVHARHPGVAIVPDMSTGATDGLYFRTRGIPVYGVGGPWIVVPDDERAHGRDERIPVRGATGRTRPLSRSIVAGSTPRA